MGGPARQQQVAFPVRLIPRHNPGLGRDEATRTPGGDRLPLNPHSQRQTGRRVVAIAGLLGYAVFIALAFETVPPILGLLLTEEQFAPIGSSICALGYIETALIGERHFDWRRSGICRCKLL